MYSRCSITGAGSKADRRDRVWGQRASACSVPQFPQLDTDASSVCRVRPATHLGLRVVACAVVGTCKPNARDFRRKQEILGKLEGGGLLHTYCVR